MSFLQTCALARGLLPIRGFLLVAILVMCGLGVGLAKAAEPISRLLSEGQKSLAAGKPREALDLLLPAEIDYAGTPEYDYLLGIAAVRAGEPSIGLLVLDRLLMVEPQHAGGRLERAIALLQLGQVESADKEFAALEAMNPPDKAAKMIKQYRDHIALRKRQKSDPSYTFILGSGLGYDSNVNSAPVDYVLEIFGGLFQTRISEQDSGFYDVKAQYMGDYPLDAKNSIQLTAALQNRFYHKTAVEGYNLSVFQASGNWRYKPTLDLSVNTGLDVARVFTGKPLETLFDQFGVRSGVVRPIFNESLLSLSGMARASRYIDHSDSDFNMLGTELSLVTPMNTHWSLRFSANLEREFADGDRDGGDAWRTRLQMTSEYRLNNKQKLLLNLTYQRLNYEAEGFEFYNQLVAVSRTDHSLQAGATFVWLPSRNWLVSTEARYRDQSSSIDFFELDQLTANVNVSYLWR